MFSCATNSNTSCLNGGQCLSDQCQCPTACFLDARCQTRFNTIDLPFTSAILEDLPSTRTIYIVVITLLVAIGLLNNLSALLTFCRETIRLTACGIYLLVFSSCTIVLMVFLQTTVLTIAEYDSPSFRRWSCYVNPYISLTMGYTGIWISVGIAVERMLIECFNLNFYGSRRHAIFISSGFILFSALSNLPAIFARTYDYDPRGKLLCMYDYVSHPSWEKVDTVFSYIHVIVPCAAHLICSICVLITIVRRKILIHRHSHPKQALSRVCLRQLYLHRDFFIPPIFLFTCLLPNSIHGHLLVHCVPYGSYTQLRVHIALILLMYIPSTFIYIVYIYPSDTYRKEFSRLWCVCIRR